MQREESSSTALKKTKLHVILRKYHKNYLHECPKVEEFHEVRDRLHQKWTTND